MKILEHIAQDIAEKTSSVLGYPISITDNEGYIIGSTDKERLGIFHRPSLDVIKKKSLINCRNEDIRQILPGVSVPITINNKAIGVLGIVGEPEEVEKYVHLVKNQVEMMCQDAFRKEMKELESKMVEVFIQQIIHYDTDEQDERIIQYAKTLGYNQEIRHVCILIDIHRPSHTQDNPPELHDPYSFPYFQRDVLDFIHLIFHDSEEDILSFINIERLIIVKPIATEQAYSTLVSSLEQRLHKLNNFLQAKYNLSASIAVGDVQKGVSGMAESFRNAEKTMVLGRKADMDSNIFLYNEKHTTFQLLPKEITPELQKKLLSIIQPLTRLDNYDVLSSTFLAYCRHNMNLSEAARNMFIHRNTIIYRLEKVNEATHLDTSSFQDCMLLYMAISCYGETKECPVRTP
ncbi:transcriptional regulator [Bacillus aerolatus]|uniref:Transcriptional regulator n=1 Tax=Bacillus aerolatus TaxID=2653354 RepID=A0A6I1FBZ9_9BACI|nr:sugar diacid recognition domain-containing protein [Bacillus aerolatus]KAB7704770.1 transcriptional regulator [Bacillus aerolatus]